MKVVSPFRPFLPESAPHLALGHFDWLDALRMLRVSVRQACGCETFVITDVDTSLDVPAYHYVTEHRRLMLWMLEVAVRYLDSDDFDDDTVMVCPDLLVYHDLQPYFRADLGLLVRGEKFRDRPVINSVQWWRVAAKARLVPFMQTALAIAQTLPESIIVWGADTEPLRRLIEPIHSGGAGLRQGVSVAMLPFDEIVHELSSRDWTRLSTGLPIAPPPLAITDFKARRKVMMRAYFDATIGAGVPS